MISLTALASWLVLAVGVAVVAFGLLALFAAGMSTSHEASRRVEKRGVRTILAGAVIFAASWLI